jgi:aspartate kinase
MPLILQQKPWIVQKYGGTSLGKLLPAITRTIIPQYLESHNVAVVCSAMSGTSKSMGTTSLLLKAIDHAINPLSNSAHLDLTINTIRDQHLETSKALQNDLRKSLQTSVFWELDQGIIEECEQLRSFLVAAQVRHIGNCSA